MVDMKTASNVQQDYTSKVCHMIFYPLKKLISKICTLTSSKTASFNETNRKQQK